MREMLKKWVNEEIGDFVDLSLFPKKNKSNFIDWKNIKGHLVKTKHLGQNFKFIAYYKYSKDKRHKIKLVCKDCNSTKEVFSNHIQNGIGCNICKSNYSLPERVVCTLLSINNINFKTQATFNSLGQKRFDFLVMELGHTYLIEVNGGQHYYNVSNWDSDLTMKNDEDKLNFCKKYDISLVVLDCRNYTIKSIITQLIDTELKYLITINNVEDVRNNLFTLDNVKQHKRIIDLYQSGMKYKDINLYVNKPISEIHRILHLYNIDMRYGESNRGEWRKRKIRCINTGEIFDSLVSASKYANLKTSANVWRHLKDCCKSAGKHPVTGEPLTWEYVDNE